MIINCFHLKFAPKNFSLSRADQNFADVTLNNGDHLFTHGQKYMPEPSFCVRMKKMHALCMICAHIAHVSCTLSLYFYAPCTICACKLCARYGQSTYMLPMATCTLCARSVDDPCTLRRQPLHTTYTFCARSMHAPCTLCIHFVQAPCMLCTRFHSPITLHACYMKALCTLRVHSVHALCMFRSCSVHAPCTLCA